MYPRRSRLPVRLDRVVGTMAVLPAVSRTHPYTTYLRTPPTTRSPACRQYRSTRGGQKTTHRCMLLPLRALHFSPSTRHGHGHGNLEDELDLVSELGRKAMRITYVGMACNVALAGTKLGVGLMAGSAALVADAAHSASDMVSDIVTIGAVKMSRRPADERHPFGYGHYETLGTLSVSAMLVLAGAGTGYHSIEHLIQLVEGKQLELTMVPAAMVCVAVSILVKEMLFQATIRVGREARSTVLLANAWHHRSDAFSSLVALGGIGGAAMGFPLLDPLGGVLVAGMITKTGGSIGWGAVQDLTDRQEDSHVAAEVRRVGETLVSQSDGELVDIHDIRVRRMGHYALVDLHITVHSRLSVTSGHNASERVRHAIMESLPEVSGVFIHVDGESGEHDADHFDDPSKLYPSQKEVEDEVRTLLAESLPTLKVRHVVVHHVEGGMELEIVLSGEKPKGLELLAWKARAVLFQQLPTVTRVGLYQELIPLDPETQQERRSAAT